MSSAWPACVANNIEVCLTIIQRRRDPEIADGVVEAIKRELLVSWEKLKAIVEDGWITLEGDVEWYYQREWAG
jgi:osmotically-inducible protein OsmY